MIDWDRIEELRAEFGDEDLVDLGREFLAEIAEKLREMERAARFDRADFHFLRGSAANLGLTDFAALCGEAEAAIETGDTIDLPKIAKSFEQSCTEIAEIFEP